MVRFLGAFVLSLVISNWIYAEFLLFVPNAEPYIARAMHVLSIPTHNEWPDIAAAPGARALGNEVDAVVSQSALKDFFVSVGIGDSAVQQTLRGKPISQTRLVQNARSTVSEAQSSLFETGRSMFLESAPEVETFGGYQRFLF